MNGSMWWKSLQPKWWSKSKTVLLLCWQIWATCLMLKNGSIERTLWISSIHSMRICIHMEDMTSSTSPFPIMISMAISLLIKLWQRQLIWDRSHPSQSLWLVSIFLKWRENLVFKFLKCRDWLYSLHQLLSL